MPQKPSCACWALHHFSSVDLSHVPEFAPLKSLSISWLQVTSQLEGNTWAFGKGRDVSGMEYNMFRIQNTDTEE